MMRFDGHCHLFNVWFLVREAAAIAWDMVTGDYPRRPKIFNNAPKERKLPKLNEVLDFIQQVCQVVTVLKGDYQDNFEFLQKKYKEAYGDNTDVCAIPLMMDIYFMFAGEYEDNRLAKEKIRNDPTQEFDEWFDQAKTLIVNAKLQDVRETKTREKIESDINQNMQDIYTDITEDYANARRNVRVIMTPGYKKDIKECIKLQNKNVGKVFPFLAVDPRRTGMLKLIKDGSSFGVNGPLVSANGPFYGIKLYPILGYVPIDNITVLEWCKKNDIPITVHCNEGGFSPMGNKYEKNNNPALWNEVFDLIGMDSLRIDFAHFASQNSAWRDTIIEFISNEKYGGKIFTDISCYTNVDKLKEVKLAYLDQKNKLNGHVIFGTDFDIMLLTGLKLTLDDYFANFRKVFYDEGSEGMEDDLTFTAPQKFLKLMKSN